MALVLLGFGGLVAGAYAIGPVPVPCSVAGAGTLAQRDGRVASFTGLAVAPVSGVENYDAAAGTGPLNTTELPTPHRVSGGAGSGL